VGVIVLFALEKVYELTGSSSADNRALSGAAGALYWSAWLVQRAAGT
jgi:hypothetical protein